MRPGTAIAGEAKMVEAVATTAPDAVNAADPPSGDPIQAEDGAVLAQRFADAFAPGPAEPDLAGSLRQKAESSVIVPMPADPHQGVAPREDWDRLQQVPD